jgi:outer membrane protein TolC
MVAEINLQILLGLSTEEPLHLTDSLIYVTPDSVSVIAENKWELLAAGASIDLTNAQLTQSRSHYFPDIGAFAGFSYGKPNLDYLNNTWNSYWTVGGQLSWSFNVGGKTSHEVRKAKYLMQSAQHEYNQVTDQLSREAQVALRKEHIAHQNYTTALAMFNIASDHYRLAKSQHKNGVLSTNRLIEIETTLTEAESTLAAALAEYYIAKSTFYFVTGSTKIREGL